MAKRCCRCGKIKDNKDFYKNKATIDSLSNACKLCTYTPRTNRTKFKSALEVYESCVVKKDGCWSWNGSKDSRGYCSFSFNGTSHIAHRFSYETFNGPIPEGKLIRHTCDNPECTNPEHLLVGDHKDNANDMVERKRHVYGEKAYNAKLTEADVIDIKTNCPVGSGYAEYARKYGVSHITIRDIVLGKYWRHVKVGT